MYNLKFLRKFYQIPRKQKIYWCLLQPFDGDLPTDRLRLGIMFAGTNKAIDVAARRIVQLNGIGPIRYRAHIAKRRSVDGAYEYVSGNLKLVKPKHYVQDLYYACVYSKELMTATLY